MVVKRQPNVSAGYPTPEPVRQKPPADRFCDLILTGGVASGVVYPWAIIELARHYRFRSIGGNSVGAMAAALAAAAEYGRCRGNRAAFEPLRLSPGDLAEEDEQGRTRMLRLFQPAAGVRGLFNSLLIGIRHFNAEQPKDDEEPSWSNNKRPVTRGIPLLLTVRDVLGQFWLAFLWLVGVLVLLLPALALSDHAVLWGGTLLVATCAFVLADYVLPDHCARWRGQLVLALLGLLGAAHLIAALFLCTLWTWPPEAWTAAGFRPLLGVLGWTFLIVLLALRRLGRELPAFRDNNYGLCSGRAQPDRPGEPPTQKALVEWLHEGIQRSAGREKDEPPLTFRDLWSAPRDVPLPDGEKSIELQTFSTNVTLARPVIWPLRDRNTRLFFRKDEWERIFPPTLLNALWDASVPYTRLSDGDPCETPHTICYRELPDADMPIAIAARLSLSFPLLFSCVPVYAIDYEERRGRRRLRKCLLTDGGVCTNFPIHLFDAAHPRWPTFGLLLSRRIGSYRKQPVWLPDRHGEGRADNWSRGVPGAERARRKPAALRELAGLLFGMLETALSWNDNILSRLPHSRNRIVRMALRAGEGQVHITMPRSTILEMAHVYGTEGGRKLVEKFVSDTGTPTVAWREHLYVRAITELRSLEKHLRGYADAVSAAGFNKPLARILRDAVGRKPLRGRDYWPKDDLARALSPQQEAALQAAVQAVADLSRTLEKAEPDFGPYKPVPATELRLRSPI